jgi:hypothetical protein
LCFLKWCVDFISLVFKYFGESLNIKMDNKNANWVDEIQFKELNDIFIATLVVWLFYNYTIQLRVNLAKNASRALLLMSTSCKMLHNKHKDNQGYIIIGPMRVEVVYLGCLLSNMTKILMRIEMLSFHLENSSIKPFNLTLKGYYVKFKWLVTRRVDNYVKLWGGEAHVIHSWRPRMRFLQFNEPSKVA